MYCGFILFQLLTLKANIEIIAISLRLHCFTMYKLYNSLASTAPELKPKTYF